MIESMSKIKNQKYMEIKIFSKDDHLLDNEHFFDKKPLLDKKTSEQTGEVEDALGPTLEVEKGTITAIAGHKGIFYSSVKIGDKVDKDQEIGFIQITQGPEKGKTEIIKATTNGVIKSILPPKEPDLHSIKEHERKNKEILVESEQTLFIIEKK